MKRELRRGQVFKAKNGTIYVCDRDGVCWAGPHKRRERYVNPECRKCSGHGILEGDVPAACKCNRIVLDVSDAEFQANPDAWVRTEEEDRAVKQQHLEAERAVWKRLGKPMPEKLERMILGSQEDKQVLSEEEPKVTRRGPGRPRGIATKG